DTYVKCTVIGIVSAIVAALAAAVNYKISLGRYDFDPGGIVATVSFLIGIGVWVFILVVKPERAWYEGRAAAESVKTLCWQYCVGGGIFSYAADRSLVGLLLERMQEVVESMKSIELQTVITGSQITEEMMRLRAAPLSV